jgi:hypothetical protein
MKNQLSLDLNSKSWLNSLLAFIFLGLSGHGLFNNDPETFDPDSNSFTHEPEMYCDDPD